MTERHRSPANGLFSKRITDPALMARGGAMVALRRAGPASSFESFAHSVTRDVHSPSLLDELCRLDLACVADDGDAVRIVRDSFVPLADSARLPGFAGMNVGDHLRAAACQHSVGGTDTPGTGGLGGRPVNSFGRDVPRHDAQPLEVADGCLGAGAATLHRRRRGRRSPA